LNLHSNTTWRQKQKDTANDTLQHNTHNTKHSTYNAQLVYVQYIWELMLAALL